MMLGAPETAKSLLNANEHKANMRLISVILLAIMAGGSIAMGDIFWAHATVGFHGAHWPAGFANFLGGISFSVGLMMVVFFGGHLFTSSILSGMDATCNKLTWGKTLSYWVVVWIFNFVGSVCIAVMYYYSKLPLNYGGEILKHFMELGVGKTNLDFLTLFIRGIFCNVFVCMAIWTASSADDLAGKVLAIMFMIGAFVASGYEHCVANMFIIPEALLSKAHYLAQFNGDINALSNFMGISVEKLQNLSYYGFFVKNLIPVTIGNIVGGLGFVGLIGLYSHKPDMKL